jgi:hypothetical protein
VSRPAGPALPPTREVGAAAAGAVQQASGAMSYPRYFPAVWAIVPKSEKYSYGLWPIFHHLKYFTAVWAELFSHGLNYPIPSVWAVFPESKPLPEGLGVLVVVSVDHTAVQQVVDLIHLLPVPEGARLDEKKEESFKGTNDHSVHPTKPRHSK